ncbi:hypothetical protein P167DRAFT_389850 [Morchella conica CCBAS932]|uniref:Uncharacterized protein n=1 Tax=Morchella conica CCBAS932 TaxID=1392247 RepID=A0A3N4KPS7_9PEZI|nr:hypothetical protein P167DRAFT_389850 [Morchella conica CCBAS932]
MTSSWVFDVSWLSFYSIIIFFPSSDRCLVLFIFILVVLLKIKFTFLCHFLGRVFLLSYLISERGKTVHVGILSRLNLFNGLFHTNIFTIMVPIAPAEQKSTIQRY